MKRKVSVNEGATVRFLELETLPPTEMSMRKEMISLLTLEQDYQVDSPNK